MTTVLAIARDGVVVMAADRQTTYQGTILMGARKIRRLAQGRVLLAAAGDGALPQMLDRHLHLDDLPDPSDDDACDSWAEALAEAVAGVAAGSDIPMTGTVEGSTILDGALLIGYAGRIWYVFTNQACPAPDGIAGIGSGSEYALGYTHAVLPLGDPVTIAMKAVELACRLDANTGLDQRGPLVETLGC